MVAYIFRGCQQKKGQRQAVDSQIKVILAGRMGGCRKRHHVYPLWGQVYDHVYAPGSRCTHAGAPSTPAGTTSTPAGTTQAPRLRPRVRSGKQVYRSKHHVYPCGKHVYPHGGHVYDHVYTPESRCTGVSTTSTHAESTSTPMAATSTTTCTPRKAGVDSGQGRALQRWTFMGIRGKNVCRSSPPTCSIVNV